MNTQRYRILTIDDEQYVRESFKNFLEDYEYEILQAGDGEEGIAVFDAEKPDMVLVDLRMPKIDGLDVLAHIKKTSPDTPVIVISGTGNIDDVIEALRLGAWDYLLKPVHNLTVLLHTIQKSMEKAELLRENKLYQQNLEKLVKERTEELRQNNIKLQNLNERLKEIVKSTQKLSMCNNIKTFGKNLIKEFSRIMAAGGGSLYLVEEEGLNLLAGVKQENIPQFIPFPLKKDSVFDKVMSTRLPLLIENVDKAEGIRSSGRKNYPNPSLLAFPLLNDGGEVIALLSLHGKKHPPFIEQDKEIGSIISNFSCEVMQALKTNEELKIREEKFRMVVQSSLDGMVAVDQEGKITIFNPAAAKLLGVKEKDVINRPLDKIIPPLYRKKHNRLLERFFRSDSKNKNLKRTLDIKYENPNGKKYYLQISLSYWQSKNEQHVLAVLHDITKQKSTEKALRESELKFRQLFYELPDAIFICQYGGKNDGKILEANFAAEKQTGFALKELLGKNIKKDISVNSIYPSFKDFNAHLEKKQSLTFIEQKKKKDGSTYWSEVIVTKFNYENSIAALSVNRDITKQKIMEDALRESEIKFRTLTEFAPIAILIYQDGKFIYANATAEQVTGYTKEQLLRMHFWEVVHPEYRDLIKERGKKRQQGESVIQRYEFKILTPIGEEKWVDFRATPIEYQGRNAVLTISWDITEQKKIELRKQIIYNISGAVYSTKNLSEFFEVIRKELNNIIDTRNFYIGLYDKKNNKLNTIYYRNDSDEQSEPKLIETLSMHIIEKRENLFLKQSDILELLKDKQYNKEAIPKCWVGILMRPEKEIFGIMSLKNFKKQNSFESIDFEFLEFVAGQIAISTQKKQTESEIRKLYQAIIQSPTAVAITDPLGIIEYVNPKFTELSGYGYDECIGQKLKILERTPETEAIYDNLWDTLKSGKIWIGEFNNKRKNGSSFRESITISPIIDDEGHISNFLSIEEDITEKSELQMQLRQKQKLESIGRLAGGIAHDFNNLLTPILGYSEIMLHTLAKDDRNYGKIKEIQNAADRAKKLTKQLLAFSRRQVLSMEIIDPSKVIYDFNKILKRTIRENIEFFLDLKSVGYIRADVTQLEQILMNLAINAQDAMPDGGTLTISTCNKALNDPKIASKTNAETGNYIVISVQDTGTGIEKSIIDKIFDPFFSTKAKEKGTGLGLSTVQGIVSQHNGYILVESEPGKGSNFKIFLPVVSEIPDNKEVTKETAPIYKGDETILVAEDNPSVRKLICSVLEEHGFNVIEAENGHKCLEKAKQYSGEIDLLLTDVIMPKMNGKELYQKISSFRSGLKVLYMSGYTDDVIAEHGKLEKGTNFIQKPISLKKLISTIKNILSS